MPSNRIGRINEEIQRELSTLIRTVKDPRVADAGMVSVTAVETTPDLKYAKIYVSALNKDSSAQLLKGLKSASGDKGAHILDMLRDPEVVKPANPANAHIILDEED